jgi:hypothetical protein
VTAGSGKSNLCSGDGGSGGEQIIACEGLCTAGNEVLARIQPTRGEQPDPAVNNLNMFEHRDSVGAVGDRRPSHDLACRIRGKGRAWRIAGTNRARKGKESMSGCFGGAAGKAIACGASEWRLIDISAKRLSQHPSRSVCQSDALLSRDAA